MLRDPRMLTVQTQRGGDSIADVASHAAAGCLLSLDDFSTQLHDAAATVLVHQRGR